VAVKEEEEEEEKFVAMDVPVVMFGVERVEGFILAVVEGTTVSIEGTAILKEVTAISICRGVVESTVAVDVSLSMVDGSAVSIFRGVAKFLVFTEYLAGDEREREGRTRTGEGSLQSLAFSP